MVEKPKVRHPEFARRLHLAAQPIGVTINDIKTEVKVTYEMARRYWKGIAKPRGKKMELLAALLKISPADLEYGERGTATSGVRDITSAPYDAFSKDAREVALAWSKLSPSKRQLYRDAIFRDAAAETILPWLRMGRPERENYDAFEKRVERSYHQHLRQLKLEI